MSFQCKTNEVKDFQHLHFTAWPDRGVPDNPSVMLQFRDIVMSEHTFLDGPILVHCR
jgi:receptor-type tyrosine-protein phosphatase C